jgi:hypothetical protein
MRIKSRDLDNQNRNRKPWAQLFIAASLSLASACGNPDSTSLPPMPDMDAGIGESVRRKDGANDLKDLKGKADSARDALASVDIGRRDLSPDMSKPDSKSACALSSSAAFNGYIVYGTPKTVGGYSFDYLGKSGSDAIIGISCGGAATASAQKCPVGLTTTINVAADGKKITLVPVSANATVVKLAISVDAI